MKLALPGGLLTLALALPCFADPGVTGDTIAIGQSVVLSGPLAENGVQYTKGIKLYLDQVNAKGGVNGRKIELTTVDDAYDPKRAEENTRKLIEEKQVFALFGYAGTGATLAALPLAEKAQTPLLAPYTGAEALRAKPSPVLYHLRAGYGDEMEKIVEHQTTVGIKNIAIAYQNDNFGKAGLKSFEEAMARRNLKPAAVAAIDPATLDAKATVAELNKATPAAVVLATAGKASSAVVREFIRIGHRPQFFGLSAVSASQMRSDLQGDVSGIVIAQVVPSPWSTKFGVVRQYREALGGKAEEAHHASFEGYIAARVLVEGLKRAGRELTRSKLLAALDGMRRLDLGDYFIDFGNGRHIGSSYVDLSILRPGGQFLQ